MVLMIIKGIFRRYERWNPVHPTYGAFWGMGIGIGCGVGWGPGFGPEVVGYVGAGCGVGFSVGITLAGVGIGLPANFLFTVPYNTAVATTKGAMEFFGSNYTPFLKNFPMDGWNDVRPQITALQRELCERFSSFHQMPLLNKGIDIKNLPMSISDECGKFGNHLLRACKGLKDRHRGDPSAI